MRESRLLSDRVVAPTPPLQDDLEQSSRQRPMLLPSRRTSGPYQPNTAVGLDDEQQPTLGVLLLNGSESRAVADRVPA